MKKYKYFHRSDVNKEAIGKVNAKSINEAILKSSEKKKLSFEKFLIIFGVEEINERKN
jgi:hypothetical protein